MYLFLQECSPSSIKRYETVKTKVKISGKSKIFDFADAPSSERLGLSRQNVEERPDVYDVMSS